MKLPYFIARRYLFAKKSRNIVNYISLISGIIIAFVSMAMILVLSTFNGIDNLVKDLYSTLDPEITITPHEGQFFEYSTELQSIISNQESIKIASPVLEGQVVLQSGKQQLVATLYGVDSSFFETSRLGEALDRGEATDFFNPKQRNIIIGAGLHYHLKRGYEFPSFDPIVVLNIPKGTKISTTSFSSFNKTAFTEIGTFRVTAEFDLNYAFISKQHFEAIFKIHENQASFLALTSTEAYTSAKAKSALKTVLNSNLEVKTREEKNALLFQTSQSEKWVSFAIMFFIVIVAAFNIVASLCILVMEKRQDLFVLKTIGLSERKISLVFFFQSLLINVLGLIVGTLLGITLVYLQQEVGLLRLQGAMVEFYPVELRFQDLILVFVTIISIAVITFWPVQRLVRKIV